MKNYEALKDDPKRTGESRLTAFPVFFLAFFPFNKSTKCELSVTPVNVSYTAVYIRDEKHNLLWLFKKRTYIFVLSPGLVVG